MSRSSLTRKQVFDLLKARGAAQAVVSYSGGNDEGGCDEILLRDAGGNQLTELEEYHGGQVWAGGKLIEAPPPTEEQQLSLALCAPVYAKYHGFAGDFRASGEVIWDVASSKVTMDGSELHMTSSEIEEYL